MSQAIANIAPDMTRTMADAMKDAIAPLSEESLAPGTQEITSTMNAVKATLDNLASVLEAMEKNEKPPVESNITVDISTAVTPDSEAMTWLADTVADKITPVVERAIGSDLNGY